MNMAAIRSIAREIAMMGLLSIALYWAVDWGFGRINPVKPYAGNAERLTASAYRNEPYFSETFLVESFTQPRGWDTPSGLNIVLPRPYDGKYFHVDVLAPTSLAYRRTHNPAAHGGGERVVLLLGGSSIYNSEVPDDLTIASQLSNLLNRNSVQRYRVVNAGVTASTTAQDLERLKLEFSRGLRPWAVITLNGVNDIHRGVYFANAGGAVPNNAGLSGYWGKIKAVLPTNIWRYFRGKAEQEKARVLPAHLEDPKRIDDLMRAAGQTYLSNISAMEAACRAHGARFWSVLQPHAFSADYLHPSNDIMEAGQLALRTLPRTRDVLDKGYGALRDIIGQLAGKGVRATDGSAVFARKTKDIFLDLAHVNSEGNRIMAEFFAGIVMSDAKNSISDAPKL